MRADEKELLGNVLKVSAVAWFMHTFVEVPLHEYGHYWVASLLGTTMYVDGQRAVFATGQIVPAATHALISVSGGLCAGCLLLVVFLFTRKPYCYGLLPLVAENLVYAPLEGTELGYDMGLLALVAVWILVFVVFLTRFLGWGRSAPIPRSDRHETLGPRRPHLRLPSLPANHVGSARSRAGARGFEPLS